MTFDATFDRDGYDNTGYDSVVELSCTVFEDIDCVLHEGFKAMNRMARETEAKLNTVETAYNAYLETGDVDAFVQTLGEVF